MREGKELMFMDENGSEVKVKSITKEDYSGKIYDVDVPNDVVLVRRKNENNKKEENGSLNQVERSTQDSNNIFNKLYKSFGDESPVRGAQSDSSELSYLTVWSGNSNSYDTFDLKVVSKDGDKGKKKNNLAYVEFDYIVDPTYATGSDGSNLNISDDSDTKGIPIGSIHNFISVNSSEDMDGFYWGNISVKGIWDV